VLAHGGFAVVEAPAPLPATKAGDLLSARLAAVESAVTHTPSCAHADCYRKRIDVFRAAMAGDGALDAWTASMAFLGMTYNLSGNAGFLSNYWRSSGSLTRVGVTSMKQVAHSFARVSAEGTPEPDLVGYLAAICSAYTSWPKPTNSLFEMHAVCAAGFTGAGYGSYVRQLHTVGGQVALITNVNDPVVPYEFQAAWRRALVAERVYTLRTRGHVVMPARVDHRIAGWLSAQT
jgi:hypothetical protein